MINIVEKTSMKGRTYSDITSVTPVMQGMEAQVPQASNFTIPGGSPAPAVVQQPVQPAPAPAPQATTTVTVEQPQTVQATMGQQFTAPTVNPPF
jgi:hypothetical protein